MFLRGIMEEKVILIGFNEKKNKEVSLIASLDELEALADALNLKTYSKIYQTKDKIDVKYYIGKGKLEEISEEILRAKSEGVNIIKVIFNNELSLSQNRNLNEYLDVEILDRTKLIIDIFSKRAKAKEAVLQVELAKLKYELPRMKGKGISMSRIGGRSSGSKGASRGSGETKLELDKRKIHNEINEIKKELEIVKKNRLIQRTKRIKANTKIAAFVGYTNSGKSTIMNYYLDKFEQSDKKVFVKDMLFATLDTYNRAFKIDNKEFILTDTVGFVSELPHNLVEAFKATLEEIVDASLLVHIIDSSNPHYKMQIDTTIKVLNEIGVNDTEMVYVFNKIDLLNGEQIDKIKEEYKNSLLVSAVNDENMDILMKNILEILFKDNIIIKMLIPYENAKDLAIIKQNANIIKEEYRNEGTLIEIEGEKHIINRYNKYILEGSNESK